MSTWHLSRQIEGHILNLVNKFKYLDSTVITNNRLNVELDTQLLNVFKAFGDLSIKTYTIVFSTLLYGTATWMVYKADAQKLHVSMMHHLHKVLNVKWW